VSGLTRKTLTLALLAALVWQPLSASELPALGDVSQAGLSPAQEREIGEAGMKELRRANALVEDPEVVSFINRMGNRLVEAARISDIRFTFFPVKDASVNAFAMPGGFIGVHTGLIVMTQHESELASVLAHEIAHVSQHHLARMLDKTSESPWVSLASIALAILAVQAGRGDAANAALMAGAGFNIQRQLDFTYEFEQEADRIGMQTLLNSGYDPTAMPTFFERLQKYNRFNEANAPEFLRTHPVTFKRIADAQERLNQVSYRQIPDTPDFLFVREKVRTMQMEPKDAVSFYRNSLQSKRYADEAAYRYGLAYALAENGQYAEAQAALAKAQQAFGLYRSHPALEYLAGNILLAQGKHAEAVKAFGESTKRFPSSRALAYGEIDAMIAAGQLDLALTEILDARQLYNSDPWLYQREAVVYSKQAKQMAQHKALGEYYAALQEYRAAIEQFEIAQRQPGNDFYLLSGIEARLRELKGNSGKDLREMPAR
jgi:predicted Zn-dependent protease